MLILRRTDPARNMARFYALSLETSLFGEVVLIRRWGRIGAFGRVRSEWFDSQAAAAERLAVIAALKARRGYSKRPVTAAFPEGARVG
jgi:predicted DNA-binding WGR domain protein